MKYCSSELVDLTIYKTLICIKKDIRNHQRENSAFRKMELTHFYLFFPLNKTKNLGHCIQNKWNKTENLREEGSPARDFVTRGTTLWWVPRVFFLLHLSHTWRWKSQLLRSIKCENKKGTTKACSLEPKDQRKGSLARQKTFRQQRHYYIKRKRKLLSLPLLVPNKATWGA